METVRFLTSLKQSQVEICLTWPKTWNLKKLRRQNTCIPMNLIHNPKHHPIFTSKMERHTFKDLNAILRWTQITNFKCARSINETLFHYRQPSPNSVTTNTSTVSSSCTDNETVSTQGLGQYSAAQQQQQPQQQQQLASSESSTPATSSSTTSTATCIGSTTNNITRSVSAPAGPRPQLPSSSGSTNSTSATVGQRPRLARNQSRTEAIKKWVYSNSPQADQFKCAYRHNWTFYEYPVIFIKILIWIIPWRMTTKIASLPNRVLDVS